MGQRGEASALGLQEPEAQNAHARLQVLVWDPIALHELRGLPWVYMKQPMLWVPRSLRDRICSIWCGLLHDAVQSREAEYAYLLLLHSAQLLLRVPALNDDAMDAPGAVNTSGDNGDAEHAVQEGCVGGDKAQSMVSQVRERVVLAEKGAWGQLVHNLYVEVCHGTNPSEARRRDA